MRQQRGAKCQRKDSSTRYVTRVAPPRARAYVAAREQCYAARSRARHAPARRRHVDMYSATDDVAIVVAACDESHDGMLRYCCRCHVLRRRMTLQRVRPLITTLSLFLR